MRAARAEVERSCDHLLHPTEQTLEACLAALGTAAESLRECRSALPAGNPGLLRQARGLQAAIRRAGSLLNTAAEYHGKWLQILCETMAGYTAGGTPGEVSCNARISLEG